MNILKDVDLTPLLEKLTARGILKWNWDDRYQSYGATCTIKCVVDLPCELDEDEYDGTLYTGLLCNEECPTYVRSSSVNGTNLLAGIKVSCERTEKDRGLVERLTQMTREGVVDWRCENGCLVADVMVGDEPMKFFVDSFLDQDGRGFDFDNYSVGRLLPGSEKQSYHGDRETNLVLFEAIKQTKMSQDHPNGSEGRGQYEAAVAALDALPAMSEEEIAKINQRNNGLIIRNTELCQGDDEARENDSQDDYDRWDLCGRQWDDWEQLFEEDPDEAARQLAEYHRTRYGD